MNNTNLEYEKLAKLMSKNQHIWLITGVAGFIGSNILEFLLKNNQIVYGIDDFSTGNSENLQEVKNIVGKKWKNFYFKKGSIINLKFCENFFKKKIDVVLHHAAIGSVPRSIEKPLDTSLINQQGFLNVLYLSKKYKIKKFIYASSSSIYGDNRDKIKNEKKLGKPLSPYAFSKRSNEIYAELFYKLYNYPTIGLRYFNVFGKRQNPLGSYAAVIPKWINLLRKNKSIEIFGDGKTVRDFCFIDNVVMANIKSSITKDLNSFKVYNISCGQKTNLLQLYQIIKKSLARHGIQNNLHPKIKSFRKGDIRYSIANINKAKKDLNYFPHYKLKEGIDRTVDWFLRFSS